ncbi:hypothetical protein G0U57_002518 [Chelydra serpentina]|uniref:Reverse transcriptase domain-containing protein n=1 Tax=Chelydra serpentina TaxID=8475 RepID=A0A8T1TCT4_CHESE|nr:hypothetical protein G0U57_002518 [Chelydra serpentina]
MFSVFIDLTKAFDTVSREGLWMILSKLGCSPKLVKIICLFHEGMQSQVLLMGISLTPFPFQMESNKAVSLPLYCSTSSAPKFSTMLQMDSTAAYTSDTDTMAQSSILQGLKQKQKEH